ncbi:MAG: sigma-70 family RNA polymerase sigma factor [Pirellulaceae bacterium]|nr:sigma-70 family RNA polymerase sigma factor [Pirellulaceae bacterium]
MTSSEPKHLSDVSTCWSLVREAHDHSADQTSQARQTLLDRYRTAIERYFLGALKDPDAAEELFHEFVVKFLRGDLHEASADKGSFRAYLKTVLINLINDYHRGRQKQPLQTLSQVDPVWTDDGEISLENCLREELLERTWASLAAANAAHHAVLLMRVEDPQATAREIGARLPADIGGPLAAATARKALERARTRFAVLLLDELLAIVEGQSGEQVRDELKDLGLLPYCRIAFEKRFPDVDTSST